MFKTQHGLLCLLLLILTACGSGESNVSKGNREGILHWGNAAEPQELDPHVVTGVPEHNIIMALIEGLVSKNPTTLEPIPAVAESWSVSEDGRVYTFNIRSTARWSNGDPLTAEDFAWSWRRALLPELGNQYAYMYYPIVNAEAFATGELQDFSQVGVKVISPLSLQVTLTHPTPFFLQLLDHYSMFPVHRATIEKFGQPGEANTLWTRAGNFVGNGPFMLEQWDLNKVVKVKKNPQYWDASTVRLNGIYFYPTENVTTEERMFRAEQLHYTYDVPIEKIAVYQREKPQQIKISPYLGTYFYRFNTRLKHLSDVRVRKALAMSIDRKSLVENVLKAGQLPAYTITPPNTLGYTASSQLRYDPAAARTLLAEAGYKDGEGFPVTEILYNTHEQHRKVAVAIQQMWKKELNINVRIHNQDWKVYLDSESSGNFQISRASWIGDYVDPNSFLDMWLTGGGNNRTGWSNKTFDYLIQNVAPSAKTKKQRYAAFQEAESILTDELPIIPIYTYVSKHLVHPSVKGLSSNILDTLYFKYMYLEPESEPRSAIKP
ncbi:peptide ABC transporter substrate-binding protein [Dasania sp. GY-MA-18]|uniref:Peptide ABC transporter substrate-binding protein n=2 Tax=Spongiibacteraceae TaxID=1706375 RepID=A0A9J6RPA8_9GAMM|nr:peptide ABC transporter substrate-binding protein [Dasania sp. GY-MA-18]MCZ0866170.1 peptide ABC transporter substrate-binding protein [Dasania phycosphaerae]MCZ0869894.1 peptide ABC transporter substrate-binding protein [Dasania phycosphaerae]